MLVKTWISIRSEFTNQPSDLLFINKLVPPRPTSAKTFLRLLTISPNPSKPPLHPSLKLQPSPLSPTTATRAKASLMTRKNKSQRRSSQPRPTSLPSRPKSRTTSSWLTLITRSSTWTRFKVLPIQLAALWQHIFWSVQLHTRQMSTLKSHGFWAVLQWTILSKITLTESPWTTMWRIVDKIHLFGMASIVLLAPILNRSSICLQANVLPVPLEKFSTLKPELALMVKPQKVTSPIQQLNPKPWCQLMHQKML